MTEEDGIWLCVKAAENGPQTRIFVLIKDIPAYLAAQPKEEEEKLIKQEKQR